jgi:hypothetical protein
MSSTGKRRGPTEEVRHLQRQLSGWLAAKLQCKVALRTMPNYTVEFIVVLILSGLQEGTRAHTAETINLNLPAPTPAPINTSRTLPLPLSTAATATASLGQHWPAPLPWSEGPLDTGLWVDPVCWNGLGLRNKGGDGGLRLSLAYNFASHRTSDTNAKKSTTSMKYYY